MTVTMEMHGHIVVKSVLQLQREGRLTLAVEREGQVNSVKVFNPTATTLGVSVPYHL